jgi:fatty acid desaturase
MAAVARINPKDFFTAEEWETLSEHSSWKGLVLVAHCWLVIVAAFAAGVIWPFTIPLAVMIIGARQLGLQILMHDAAHRALHPDPKINDFVGEWLCASGLGRYRPYHLNHHRLAQQSDDPDLLLSKPFPISRASLRRKIVRDLTGQTFVKQHFGPLAAKLKARQRGEPVLAILWGEARRKRRFLVTNLMLLSILSVSGIWWSYFALWLLPQATWLPMVTRLRNIAEHACIAENEPDPMRQARTTHANLIERALVAPYFVNYHCEHHMFMHLPCYSLPRAHRLLRGGGVTAQMELQPGYITVIGMASSLDLRSVQGASPRAAQRTSGPRAH